MKEKRNYQSSNRQHISRRFYFEKLIQGRMLEGLTFEAVPAKIAETLGVSVSHGRRIRKMLTDDWKWIEITPSTVKVLQTAFDEFKE